MSATPVPDPQTVTSDGTPLQTLPEGMRVRDCVLHTDDRGSVCEIYDERWDFHDDPLVFSYFSTIRPGIIKGWALHRRHEDRYFLINGALEVVVYDGREGSATQGLVAKVYLTEHRRQIVNIPAGVWHADRNIGSSDALVVNFPTIPYDHAAPDKVRLPLDTDQIPYRFDLPVGW